jgi:hypothetical protein
MMKRFALMPLFCLLIGFVGCASQPLRALASAESGVQAPNYICKVTLNNAAIATVLFSDMAKGPQTLGQTGMKLSSIFVPSSGDIPGATDNINLIVWNSDKSVAEQIWFNFPFPSSFGMLVLSPKDDAKGLRISCKFH